MTEKILKELEEEGVFVPVVNKVLVERPDIFIPSVKFSRSVLDRGDGAVKRKDRFLLALSAASALGAEHCIKAQMDNAKKAGAAKDEILESIMISRMGHHRPLSRSSASPVALEGRSLNTAPHSSAWSEGYRSLQRDADTPASRRQSYSPTESGKRRGFRDPRWLQPWMGRMR